MFLTVPLKNRLQKAEIVVQKLLRLCSFTDFFDVWDQKTYSNGRYGMKLRRFWIENIMPWSFAYNPKYSKCFVATPVSYNPQIGYKKSYNTRGLCAKHRGVPTIEIPLLWRFDCINVKRSNLNSDR